MDGRVSIYFTAPPGAWADFGAAWLGWDVATGQPVPHPDWAADLPVAALTERPRRYGFHATLKPPFRLAGRLEELERAVQAYAQTAAPAPLGGLRLARLGRFLALVPVGAVPAVDRLAGDCVAMFDGFRAPPSDDELARRRAGGLDAVEEANLQRWGYPYVFERFRFHMTLTGPFDGDAGAIQLRLSHAVATTVPQRPMIDALSICVEDAEGRFTTHARIPLGG